MKFTKKLKKAWIDNLESGKFTQLRNSYCDDARGHATDLKFGARHCCLAVLDLTYFELSGEPETNSNTPGWEALNDLDKSLSFKLIEANDYKGDLSTADYSNVLPIIKKLPTVD